jgi:ankyrin repeat protein
LFIKQGDEIDVRGGRFKTPLAAACRQGFLSSARLLLEMGADFRGLAEHDTVMAEAAISGDVALVKLLLNQEKKAAEAGEPGVAWPTSHFHEADMACYYGNKDVMNLLLVETEGTYITEITLAGSLVGRAASVGHLALVKWLLDDLHMDIDVEGGHYGTPLRATAINGHEQIMRELLNRGANPNLRGESPGSPLVAAMDFNRTTLFDLLLECPRTDINNDDGKYGRPIQFAAYKGNPYFVRELLKKGADVHAQGGLFGTALEAATKEKHEEIVQLLLEAGAGQV